MLGFHRSRRWLACRLRRRQGERIGRWDKAAGRAFNAQLAKLGITHRPVGYKARRS
jgi:hypothetical protein